MEIEFESTMEHIVDSIRAAGYEPYDQLYGYLKTGDETYITRTGDARSLVKALDRSQIQCYVDRLHIRRQPQNKTNCEDVEYAQSFN